MKAYLGIDIGATKSHALLADENGQALGFAHAGPGNHEVVDYPGLIAVLNDLTTRALAQAGLEKSQVAGAGFGVAGYDWPSERQPTLEAIATIGLACPVEAVNDTVIGLLAGVSRGWGVAVVGGTGDNCWGWDAQRRTAHMTGDGLVMAERGGGGSVVFRAMQHVARAWGQRGPQTALSQAFIAHTGAKSVDDLLEGLVLGWYHLGAGAAPVVAQTAAAGDPLAQDALRWAAEGLADMAAGVIRQLNLQDSDVEVVQIGSMFKAGPHYVASFQAAVRLIAPQAQFVRLEAPPVTGGVLLGMQVAGVDGYAVRQRILETCQVFKT